MILALRRRRRLRLRPYLFIAGYFLGAGDGGRARAWGYDLQLRWLALELVTADRFGGRP